MMVIAYCQNAVGGLLELGNQIVKRRLRLMVTHVAIALSLAMVVATAHGSTIGDPGRFVAYNKIGLSSNRVMRGLGGPDRIEQRNDGTSTFWYHWMIERPQGDIAARGMAAFSFTKDRKLDGFEILTVDQNGKYIDSTLDAVLGLAKR
jgi:hypothetical protein